MAHLGKFGLCFAGIALVVNYYQNKRLIEKVDYLLENDYLFGQHIKEFYRRTNNLEALLAKPRAK